MLKQLMNGSSWLALRDGTNDDGVVDPKVALRAQIAKGNLPEGQTNKEEGGGKDADDKSDNEGDDDDENEESDDEGDENEEEGEEKVELTAEQKAEKEKQERIAAKAKRKEDRVQKRFNDLTAKANAAEAEVARLKAQLDADPDKKLTAEEVKTMAAELAKQQIADKELEEVKAKFQKDCDKLQAAANKLDTEFDNKINDIATDVGPIPSFMIGILTDLENGAEVLVTIANDDELADKIYKLSPAKMTKELVDISNKLEADKKKPKKQISKVPDPVEPVKGSRASNSLTITEADTKDMATYTRKRQAQMLEQRKARGF